MKPNSIDATLAVIELIEHPSAPLKMAERFCLLLLAGRVNHSRGDWRVWPSLDRLSTAMACSPDTTRRALRGLAEARLLTVVRIGQGRGNPSVYQLEKVAISNLLDGLKRSQPQARKGRTRHPQEVQHEGSKINTKDLPSPSGDAEALACLWNSIVTRPIPSVRMPLSADRQKAYARAWPWMDPEDWRVAFEWVNRQSWMRAPGTGPHPNWTETLDRIVSKNAIASGHLERAQAETTEGPRSRAAAYQRTQEHNASKVAAMPAYIVGAYEESEEE